MELFILVSLVVIVVLIIVVSQRSLVSADEFCRNALSQIGVQQTSRWDALTNLAKLTKKYSDYEYNTIMKIVGERKGLTSKSTAQEVNAQENFISQVTEKFVALAEAYPDLKADGVYLSTMDSVNDYEDKVRISRMSYNDTVTKYNRLVRQFPTCILAPVFGFSVYEYLKIDETKTVVPEM